MADIKISQLGAASALNGTEAFPESFSGNTYKATAQQIKDFAIGTTSISGIGDGTPTGAIRALNTAVGNKAEKSDLTSIFQTNPTATQTIPRGMYFYLDGVLCRTDTGISNGAAFTENTNYKVINDGLLNTNIYVENRTNSITTLDNVGIGNATRLKKMNDLCIFTFHLSGVTISANTWASLLNVPANCIPTEEVYGLAYMQDTDEIVRVSFSANNSTMTVRGKTAISNSNLLGQLCWFTDNQN